MARQIHLQRHLSLDDLERRYRVAKEPNERSWWQILWLLSQGHTAVAVSAVTGYSAYWIGQIAKRYNTEGPAGTRKTPTTHSNRPPPPQSTPFPSGPSPPSAPGARPPPQPTMT